MAVSFQCMTKSTTNKKIIIKQTNKKKHILPWLIRVNVWQKPLQYYKVISLQLIKINEKKNTLRDQ